MTDKNLDRVKLIILLAGVAATIVVCQSCEAFEAAKQAAQDPEGQAALGGAANNLVKGNYLGAVINLIEYAVVAAGTYKATMIARDGRRRKRGEPSGKVVASAGQGK